MSWKNSQQGVMIFGLDLDFHYFADSVNHIRILNPEKNGIVRATEVLFWDMNLFKNQIILMAVTPIPILIPAKTES